MDWLTQYGRSRPTTVVSHWREPGSNSASEAGPQPKAWSISGVTELQSPLEVQRSRFLSAKGSAVARTERRNFPVRAKVNSVKNKKWFLLQGPFYLPVKAKKMCLEVEAPCL